MEDRNSRYPGRVKLIPVPGQANVYDMVHADQPITDGTPYSKATTIPDDVAQKYQVSSKAATIADIFRKLITMTEAKICIKDQQADGAYPATYQLDFAPDFAIMIGYGSGGQQAISFVSGAPGAGGTRTMTGKSGLVQDWKIGIQERSVVITGSAGGELSGAHNQRGKYERIIAFRR